MGYVKKQAYQIADQTGAAVYEIRAAERVSGTAGFWWCGRFAMHGWDMPIENIGVDLSAYEHVTICSLIWVFSLAAPVRCFCRQAAGKIREVDYLLWHHTNGRYENAVKEMDTLPGISHSGFQSVRCRIGVCAEAGAPNNSDLVKGQVKNR